LVAHTFIFVIIMARGAHVFIAMVMSLAFADEIPEEQCQASAPTYPATDFGLDEQDKHTMVLLQETSLMQFQSLTAVQTESGTEATAAAMADVRAAIKMTSRLRQHFGPQVAKDTWHAALAEVQSVIAKEGAHQSPESAQGDSVSGAPMANGQMMSGSAQAMFQAPSSQTQQQQPQAQMQPVSLTASASELGQAGLGAAQVVQTAPHQPREAPHQPPSGPGAAPQQAPTSMHQQAAGPIPGAAPGTVTVARIAPFGKEDTATELTKHAERTQDTLVDAVENAEVAEVKRAVFRALTRLRAASIKEFDTIARLETQAIDEYNDAHHYRAENPLSYLHSSEARVTEDKYTSFH